MKKFICLLVVVSLLSACNKSTLQTDGDNTGQVLITYLDSSGGPLYTNGLNGYYEDSLASYDLYNNPMTPNSSCYFDTSLGNSILGITELGNRLKVINGYAKILIHLKKGVDDTLRGHFLNGDSKSNVFDSTWYNGVLKNSVNFNDDTFTIVKSANGYDIEPH